MRYTTVVGNPTETIYPENLFETTQARDPDNLVMFDHEWLLQGNPIPEDILPLIEKRCVVYSGTEAVNWDHSTVPDQIKAVSESPIYIIVSDPQGRWLQEEHPDTEYFVYNHWEHSTGRQCAHWAERRRNDPYDPKYYRKYLWMSRRATPDRLAIHYRLLRSGLAQKTWISQGTHNYWSDVASHDYDDYYYEPYYDHPTSRPNYRKYTGVPQPQEYLANLAETHLPEFLGGTDCLADSALFGEHESQPIWRAYHHTDIHLIAESYAYKENPWLMATEKTFKSLASTGRPWIYAQPGFYHDLAQKGYDVQIPPWDWELDPVQRLNEWWHNIENGLIPDTNGEHNYSHLMRRTATPYLPESLESYRAVKR